MQSPFTSGASHSLCCASLPPSRSAWPANNTLERKGSGASVRPSASSTTASSANPIPALPTDSGNGIPSQPSSAMCFHSARENPTGSLVSRSFRTRDTGECSDTKSAAVFASSSWSSVRISSTFDSPLVREAQDPLGDDVELDFGGSALDRVAARAQPVARRLEIGAGEPRPLPAQARRPKRLDHQFVASHVELGGVDLEDRAFGAGPVSGLGTVLGALHREAERP